MVLGEKKSTFGAPIVGLIESTLSFPDATFLLKESNVGLLEWTPAFEERKRIVLESKL